MKYTNITIGPRVDAQGGVSTVLTVLNKNGFFKQTDSKFIASTDRFKNFNFLLQQLIFMRCILLLIFYLVFKNVGVVHLHMASRGSFARKNILQKIINFFGVKSIIHLHGAQFQEFYSAANPKKQNAIKAAFCKADKVIVLSKDWKKWTDNTFNINSRIIYNSVHPITKPPIPKQTKTIRILFLGRLGERKGVTDLLKAFQLTLLQNPECELVLGGDGEIDKYKALSQQLNIEDHVIFSGWVSGQRKIDLLLSSHIYVLPSYAEGFPMGVLEAMSTGLAVISTTAGGIPDAITHKKDGFLIEPGDVSSLTNYMNKLLLSPKLREQIGEQALNKFTNNFIPKVIIPQIIEVYEELGVMNEH